MDNITDTWSSQSTSDGITTTEHYHYTYDHANRPLTTTYTFNNESPMLLQSYNYDALGRVQSRHIHNGMDSVAFNYDIRNQVTKIKSSGYEQTYFYNQMCPIGNGVASTNYNGNISATTWTYGNKTNGYMYYYDKSNRLKSTYSIVDGEWGDYWYSETFTYDAHGNITHLDRWDYQDMMDYLYLTYNGNQLIKVGDNGYPSYGYEIRQYHDNNTSGNDFAYDLNGNMLHDKDRGIATIRYNLLNLPDTIQFTNGNQIVHRYDAEGNRLTTNYYTRKVTTTVPLGNILTETNNTTNYHITRDAFHNHMVYNVDNYDQYGIEFVHNPEGYIRYYSAIDAFHFYFIKDLLGNIRETNVIDNGHSLVVQRMQYYPSGLLWAEATNSSEQPRKYNGKEFVEMHGLDEYDSKARWYYPAICRTTTMDPLAEKYYSTSPYAWCGNNFVRNVDLNGMDVYTFGEDGYFISSHKQEGAHYGIVLSADETLSYTFDFVDPINDPKAIDNGMINKVLSLKDEQISNILSKSGVFNIHGVKDKYSFIYRESNANNIEGDGRMDYVINGQVNNVPIILYEDYLFITDTQGQKYAHNTYNFGNFLWGAGADALGIPYFMVKIGSNINNYLNDPYSKGRLDSKDDQLSIKLGFQWNEK